MTRVYNFSAGPAVLPEPVLAQAAAEMLDWHGSGMSVMEMSHRGKEFIEIAAEAEKDLRELMVVPANYKVLFLQGGATGQFAAVPMNLLRGKKAADYILTGDWSKKAATEARKYCEVNLAASGESRKFMGIPPQAEWKLSADAAYVHYTPNETISGVEFHWIPETGDVPLVADMSSNILSRPVDVSKYGLIYAGAQKNIGPSGITVVIVREDLVGKALPATPQVWDYAKQAENDSMLNTPPCYAWYVCGLVFKHLKANGGIAQMSETNRRKARKLYDYIDGSGGFYRNPVDTDARSCMNIPFVLKSEALDDAFLKEARKADLIQLKGHRSVGGMRASIYNAMPEAGIDALIGFMQDFAKRNG